MSQGAKATTFGNVLEKTVEGTLLGHDYLLIGDNLPKKQRLGVLSSCVASSLTCSSYFSKLYHMDK
jgi:hypothetical protein